MQELNREANTIGSKAAGIFISNISIDLKVNIEQIRDTKSIYAITSAYRGFSYHGGKSKKCRFANSLNF